MKPVPPMSFSTRVRCVLAVVAYVCFGLGGACISVFLLLISPFLSERRRVWVGSRVLQWSWKLMCGLLRVTRNLSLAVPERAAMARLRGAIVVANHPSLIDVVILASVIPGCKLVVKPQLLRWCFLRPILRGLCIINNGDTASFLQQAQTCLSQGFNVIIFPEGTRTTPGVKSRLQRGAFHMSLLTGGPLQPIRIQTDMPFLTKEYPWWYVGEHCPHFRLSLCSPIHADLQPGESRHAAAVRLAHQTAACIFAESGGS